MATHLEPGVKTSTIWTDKIVIGGSGPLQTAGPVTVISSSGTGANLVCGGTISGATLAVATGEVGNAELATAAASGTKVSTEFSPVKTGSPSAGGLSIQAGAQDTGGGSQAWAVFGTAFAAAPTLALGVVDATGGWVLGSPVGAGSALITSENASTLVNYIAIGSGRV